MQKKSKNILKIVLDVLMVLVFAVLYNKNALGGLSFHEIAGLAIAAVLVIHLVINRAWLKGVTKKLFNAKLPGRTRAAYIVDVLLLLAVAVIIVTGIMISKVVFAGVISTQINVSGLHKTASYIALMLIGVHLGLSWNRVMTILKKLLHIPNKKALGAFATVCAIAVFALGSYNVVTTDYFSKITSAKSGGGNHYGNTYEAYETDEASASTAAYDGATSSLIADSVSSASVTQDDSGISDSEDTSLSGGQYAPQGEGKHFNGEGGASFGGGNESSSSVLTTIYENISVMAAFAVLAYYLDKLLKRKPKKKIIPQEPIYE